MRGLNINFMPFLCFYILRLVAEKLCSYGQIDQSDWKILSYCNVYQFTKTFLTYEPQKTKRPNSDVLPKIILNYTSVGN